MKIIHKLNGETVTKVGGRSVDGRRYWTVKKPDGSTEEVLYRELERETDHDFETSIIRAANAGRQSLVWEKIKDRVEPFFADLVDSLDPDERSDAYCAIVEHLSELMPMPWEQRKMTLFILLVVFVGLPINRLAES
jgi:hypothetical protein